MPIDEQQHQQHQRDLESDRRASDRLPDAGPQRVLVLLCTFNERHNLPIMLQGIWETLPLADVLVIDDNSPDGTGQWARQAAATDARLNVIVRSGKLGLGSALRVGFEWALARPYRYVINLDADQSHDPRAINRLLQCADELAGASCVAIGSRYVSGGATTGLSMPRNLISRMLNWYATRLLRLPIQDCSGSFRCYPVELLRRVVLEKLTCDGYGFLEEVLVHLAQVGGEFRELPITYHARGSGQSKLRLSDAWGALLVIHRLAIQRWRWPNR